MKNLLLSMKTLLLSIAGLAFLCAAAMVVHLVLGLAAIGAALLLLDYLLEKS